MIKKYNQFINENDEFDNNENDELIQDDQFIDGDDDINDEIINDDDLEDIDGGIDDDDLEEEEEDRDIYSLKLKELGEKLGVEIEDGKLNYEGKVIIYPSETEMYHVNKRKFKTSEEVVAYLKNIKK